MFMLILGIIASLWYLFGSRCRLKPVFAAFISLWMLFIGLSVSVAAAHDYWFYRELVGVLAFPFCVGSALLVKNLSFKRKWIIYIGLAVLAVNVIILVYQIQRTLVPGRIGGEVDARTIAVHVGAFTALCGLSMASGGGVLRLVGIVSGIIAVALGIIGLYKWMIVIVVGASIVVYLKALDKTGNVSRIVLACMGIAVVFLTLATFRDSIVQTHGYIDWVHFSDVRLTRYDIQNTRDAKVFGFISDGGRLMMWEVVLSEWWKNPVLGIGLGGARIQGLNEHNFLIFLLTRFGAVGGPIIMFFLGRLIYLLIRNNIEKWGPHNRSVLLLLLGHLLLVWNVSVMGTDAKVMFPAFVVLGFILNDSVNRFIFERRYQQKRPGDLRGNRVRTERRISLPAAHAHSR